MKNKLLAAILLSAAALSAQDPADNFNQPPAQDPPSRVARLNLIQGQVSFQPATVPDWTAATLNYPITIGDHLYADVDSRAELHIGSTAVRLGPSSAMSFMNLDDRLVQIRLDQGALIIRVKYLEADDAYEIDTAQGAITILRNGEYRIDTDPDRNATMVTVRVGEASVTSNAGSFQVHARETAYFAGDGQPQVQGENPIDAFDQFSMDQNRLDNMPRPRYVSEDMPGWQDLERNGVWTEEPDYGPVWRPRAVAAGWAPYRYGHWAWVEPWGWTWIDDAPWGFAPFHYGRWAIVGGGWAWVPGTLAPRPVYSPAMVAFVGGGGVAAVAWFPLGPREVFVPAYRVSPVYVNRVNVTTVNVTNIRVVNRVYVNRTFGVTAVDHRAFVSAQPVHRAMMTVPRDVVARGEILHTAAIAPERASVMARPGAAANVPHPSERVISRPVYAQRTPPPAAVPFTARQQALQANPGRPVDSRTINQLRTTAPVRQPAVRALPPSNSVTAPNPVNRQRERPEINPGQPAVAAPVTRPVTPPDNPVQQERRRRPEVTTPPAPTEARPVTPPTTDPIQQERRRRPEVTTPAAPTEARPVTPPATDPIQQERRRRPEVTTPAAPTEARPVTPPATDPIQHERRRRPEVTTPPAPTEARPVTPPPTDQVRPRPRPEVQQPRPEVQPRPAAPAAREEKHEEKPAVKKDNRRRDEKKEEK